MECGGDHVSELEQVLVYSIYKFSSLIRLDDIRAAVPAYDVKQELCHTVD